MARVWTILLLLLVAVGMPSPAGARSVALLIGIGDYRDPAIHDLEGPPNDVAALAALLRGRWGFAADAVTTLVDGQATRRAILSHLAGLMEHTRPGDQVFIYFSGHGTSAYDPGHGLRLPHGSGAVAAWDSVFSGTERQIVDSLLIGRRDLVPLLSRLDRGGRYLFVAFDACYSGQAVRGIQGPARYLPKRYVPIRASLRLGRYGRSRLPVLRPFPYRNLVFLAAASSREQAVDIPKDRLVRYPTHDGLPHGAFSDALLRVLSGRLAADRDRDGVIGYRELARSVRHYLKSLGVGHRPQLLPAAARDPAGASLRPVFGYRPEYPRAGVVTGHTALRLVVANPSPALRQGLAQMPGVVRVATGGDLSLITVAGGWRLMNTDGDPLRPPADTVGVLRQLQGLALFHRLGIHADAGSFRLDLSLADPTAGDVVHPGERIDLQLRSERSIRLLLLSMDTSGMIKLLYPLTRDEFRPLPAQELLRIPGDGSLRVRMPLGVDQFLAVGFLQEPPFVRPWIGRIELYPDASLFGEVEQALESQSAAMAVLRLRTAARPDAAEFID